MKNRNASILVASVLFACVCAGATQAIASDASPDDAVAADVAAIRQLGKDMGDAMISGDTDKLKQIFAEDWNSVGSSGKVMTREDFLRNHVSGDHKLESFDLGPIDVQVLGNSAVAQGGVVETRGKETNVQMIYADLLEKRAGKWLVVRSMDGRMK